MPNGLLSMSKPGIPPTIGNPLAGLMGKSSRYDAVSCNPSAEEIGLGSDVDNTFLSQENRFISPPVCYVIISWRYWHTSIFGYDNIFNNRFRYTLNLLTSNMDKAAITMGKGHVHCVRFNVLVYPCNQSLISLMRNIHDTHLSQHELCPLDTLLAAN